MTSWLAGLIFDVAPATPLSATRQQRRYRWKDGLACLRKETRVGFPFFFRLLPKLGEFCLSTSFPCFLHLQLAIGQQVSSHRLHHSICLSLCFFTKALPVNNSIHHCMILHSSLPLTAFGDPLCCGFVLTQLSHTYIFCTHLLPCWSFASSYPPASSPLSHDN